MHVQQCGNGQHWATLRRGKNAAVTARLGPVGAGGVARCAMRRGAIAAVRLQVQPHE